MTHTPDIVSTWVDSARVAPDRLPRQAGIVRLLIAHRRRSPIR
jgi:hypothetical protein